jgi:2-iminobutanoate/2-iminopropanoate deaminase
MPREVIQTDQAPRSAAYSQGIKAAGLVFVSGQGPFDPKTGEVVGTTIQEQTAQCLRNVEAILRAAGSSLAHTVSATIILAEESDFAGLNEEWVKWFPQDPPARQGAKLPVRPQGMKISVGVVALAEPESQAR